MMREEFPIFRHHPELVYLDTAATAHKPQSVIDALTQFYAVDYAAVHRSVYRSSLRATELYNEAREAVRCFLHADCIEEILFTRGTTDALNLVAASFTRAFLQPGDEILVSEMEHHSNLVPWQIAAQSSGACLRWIPMDRQGVLQWKGCITRRTKVVALAHVSNVTGTIHPIAEIVKEAHSAGAAVVVDGAQSAPHMPVDVRALDCDFYAFSGHKCYGPTGIGVLYGKKDLLARMPPIQGGGDMIAHVELEESSYAPLPLRFEAGTPIVGSAIALRAALDFMDRIGRNQMADHESMLCRSAEEKLLRIPGLRILGSPPERGPILTFHIEGVHSLDLATMLDVKNIAIRSGHLCAQPLLRAFGLSAAARASFAIYNTLEEVDLFVEAVFYAAKSLL